MIPKAELHVHLEGTIRPTVAKQLAAKNRLTLPDEIFGSDDSYQFNNFQQFMKAYDEVSKLLLCDEDYSIITYDYLAQRAQNGAVYIEMMCAPDLAILNGVSYDELIKGMTDGIKRAKNDFGIEARIIVTIVRQLGVPKAHALVEQILNNPYPHVVGLGMAGDEINFPSRDFLPAFGLAAKNHLRCTVHAGEFLGPESVIYIMECYPVNRIGHGVRASEDGHLLSKLSDCHILLELCISSNIALGIYPSLEKHPLRQILDRRVLVCLNSDDPPFFRTTLENEYKIAKEVFGLTDQELVNMTLNAINSGFMDKETKESLRTKVLEYGKD